MLSLKNLFHKQPAPSDGLTQGQREAIVDLLNYCSFIDHDLSASEGELIDNLGHQFHWDANIDFDYYVNKSIGAVRGVLESLDSQRDFLADISKRLDSKQSKATALSLADKIIKVDGRVTAEERKTYQAFRKAIGG
jgi:hypothetical protein